MHIKRLLSGSLAVMMVATSFNVPINAKAAEIPDVEPEAGLEENQELPSSDAEISLDDETNVVVEEAAEEPEVVAPEAEETPSEEPTEELVVEEETAAQDVVGETPTAITVTVSFADGVEGEDIAVPAATTITAEVAEATASKTLNLSTITTNNPPVREGYTFAGWKVGETETVLAAGGTYEYTKTEVGEETAATDSVTLTAQWKVDISKLDIELNGAALTFDNTDQIAGVTIKSAKLNGVALGEAELNKLQLEFFSDEACETQASELINKGDYFVKVSSTDAGYTGFKKIKVTISAKELTAEDVVLSVTGEDAGTEATGFNLFYATAEDVASDSEKVEGVTPKQIKPTVTIAGLTETTDFEVTYGDNNSTSGGSVKITLKDTTAAKNYSASETGFTESFKIVDVDESKTASYTTTTKAKVSATESKPGEKTGYGTKYHKKYTKVIPAIDKSASKIKGARTTANISSLTINGVFDTEDNIKDTDIYELTKAAKEGDATKVVVTVTFKDASASPDYEGSFVIEDSIIDDDDSTFTEHVDKATFNHGGRVYWAKANGEEATKGSTKVTIDGKEVTLDEKYIYDLPQLNSTVTVGTRDSEGTFSTKSTFDYDGKAVEPVVQLLDMASPTPKEVAAENYTLSYDKNTKPGTAKVTVTMTGKYYEGSTSAEFTIAELIKAPEAPYYVFDDSRVYEFMEKNGGYVSYDTLLTLKAPTNGSSIIYTISKKDGSVAAAAILDGEGARNDGVGTTYTTPIELKDACAISDVITINAVAVKDGKYSTERTFTFNMLPAAADWGDVIPDYDFDTDSSSKTAVNLPDGLWISKASLDFIGDKTTHYESNNVYDGNAKVMTGPVRIFYNNKLLTEGTDFSIAYKNNVKAWLNSDPEQYPIAKAPTITVTGKGRYAGGFTQTFEIQPQPLAYDSDYNFSDPGDRQISSSIQVVAENGKIQKPKYTIKAVINDIKKGYRVVSLKENTDFTVDYSAIEATPGIYTIPITFKGNYSGSDLQSLQVVAAEKFLNKAKITVDTSLVNIDGNDQTNNVKLTVKLGDVELKEGVDYNASYYYETLPYPYITSYADRNKVTSAGKYSVSIDPVYNRTDGGVQYAGYKYSTFTVKGGKAVSNAKLVSVEFNKSVTYSDRFNTFVLKDVELNKTLTQGTDYQIVYAKAPAVGTVKATIYGLGAYSGTKAVSYTVTGTKLTAKDNLVFTKKNFEYTGSDIAFDEVSTANNFKIFVKSDDPSVENKVLEKGTDYEIDEPGKDYINVGTKSFTVKGKGAYTGSFKVSYKIDPFDITADQAKYAVPTAAEQNPTNTNKLKFRYQEGLSWSTDKVVGYTLTSFTNVGMAPEIQFYGSYYSSSNKYFKDNFTISYSKNKNPGDTVTVTVKGKKNFTGTATMQYVVDEADISDASLVSIFVPDKQVGKWAAPKVTIKNKLQNKALAEGAKKDYTVRYTYAKQTTVANGKEKDIKRYIGDDVVKGDVISTATQIKATFTGVNRYTGTVEKYINVVAKANDIATGTFKIANKQYNDGDVTLDTADFTTAEIKSGKTVTKLTYGTDFVIDSYSKNDKVGTASVTLHGIGSYAGYKTVTFKITAKNMNYNVKFVAAPKGDDNVALTVTGATKDAANKTVNSIKLPKSGFKAVDAQKNAYIFAYWKDDLGGKWYPGEAYKAQIGTRFIDPGEYATLEAHFVKANKDAKLNITYKPGTAGAALSGKGYEDKKQTVAQGSSVTLLADNAYKVPGYTLIGWKLDNTTSYYPKEVLYNAEATAKDITLTAVWYKHTYYINYIENGGEFATIPTGSFAVDTADITLPTNITRAGYTFAGWKNAKGKVVTKIEKGTVGDQKLTAQWTATENAFKVTFAKNATEVALNTGSKLPDAIQFTPGKAVKIPADKLVAANDQFTFVGWSDEDKADTPKYKPNANAKFEGNVTLYPVWKESGYTITYVPNGGKLSGTYAKTFTKATSSTVTLATPTMLGKKFDGWEAVENVKNGAKVELTGTAPSQKLPANLTKTVRLTAKWAADEASVKVTFNANGGAGTAPEQQTITAVGAALTANVFTKENYTFKGWDTASAGTTVVYNDAQVVTAGELGTDTPLYAVWEADSYKIKYTSEIPFKATASPIRKYSFGSEDSLPTDDGNTFVDHTGYEFVGWYEVESSSVTTIPEGATKVGVLKNTDNKDRFFIAKWDKTEYTITLTLDSGSLSEADATAWANKKYTVEDSVTLPTPTRTGYTFAGWTGTDLEKATTSVTIPEGSTGNKEYTATWTEWEKTVTFDKNTTEATVTAVPEAIKVKYSDTPSLAGKTPSGEPAGKEFKGWSTTSAGEVISDLSVLKPSSATDTTITLYAVWGTPTTPEP
ncbi:Listeria/Bacterioides repeat-containing protein [Pseudobutyrivibrio sp. OR37]|uniref:InlB B-repeat-containing protein n=1 Tax=Pseudobutyrivibrio sp. OR37 TaxID=1798186 RepID=UPI0008E25F54|nr:InlB B-repeat-containing protein [Pseudobutyrivibrio sp. OR37]SFH99127.1 Listeria/Bacterioides repeat-containing protein [Pseudobutyrivibrio sp. OR37]